MNEKIYASLLCAAVGDAMSIAAETKTTDAIFAENKGYITDLIPTPPDGLSAGVGHPAGMLSAAFSSAYYLADSIIRTGACTFESVKRGLLLWAERPEYFKFVGPNSKKGIAKLQGVVFPIDKQDTVACFNRGASTGAAMRAGILGLLFGDADDLIDKVITMCLPTHNNYISIAGAGAVASAVARALKDDASVYDTAAAGIQGAVKAYQAAEKTPGIRPAAGPCLRRRIQMAVQIGLRNKGHFDTALRELCDFIGSTIYTVDAVPAAFGCLCATSSPEEAVRMAVNMGDDCTPVATMTGFMAGAIYGKAPEFQKFATRINTLNQINLEAMANLISEGGVR